jgi:ABC-2 type transport system permease protein
MTTLSAALPASGGSFRWILSDSWTVARRDLVHWVRNPTVIVSGLAFPIMFVLVYGYVFGSAMVVPGGGDYREYLMPGMFAQSMMFGAAATISVVATDRARGVTDRFRSMPMAQSAVVIGRSTADIVNSMLELAVLVGCGLLIGWSAKGGFLPTLAAIGLLLLLRFAMIWVGIYLGLIISPEASAIAWAPLFPLSMISNTFASPSQMPAWLGTVAEWNPLSATVGATRQLFGNTPPGLVGESWAAQNALLLAVVWPVLIVAVFLPLAVRRYNAVTR